MSGHLATPPTGRRTRTELSEPHGKYMVGAQPRFKWHKTGSSFIRGQGYMVLSAALQDPTTFDVIVILVSDHICCSL